MFQEPSGKPQNRIGRNGVPVRAIPIPGSPEEVERRKGIISRYEKKLQGWGASSHQIAGFHQAFEDYVAGKSQFSPSALDFWGYYIEVKVSELEGAVKLEKEHRLSIINDYENNSRNHYDRAKHEEVLVVKNETEGKNEKYLAHLRLASQRVKKRSFGKISSGKLNDPLRLLANPAAKESEAEKTKNGQH